MRMKMIGGRWHVYVVPLLLSSPPLVAQRAAGFPPPRTGLTQADSIALVSASARAAIPPRDGRPVCVIRVDASVGGPVGEAFLVAARNTITTLPAANDSASYQGVTLLGVRDGDTARVILRVSGSGPSASAGFGIDESEYLFVRNDTVPAWRYLRSRLLSVADGETTGPARRRRTCMNGRVK